MRQQISWLYKSDSRVFLLQKKRSMVLIRVPHLHSFCVVALYPVSLVAQGIAGKGKRRYYR